MRLPVGVRSVKGGASVPTRRSDGLEAGVGRKERGVLDLPGSRRGARLEPDRLGCPEQRG